MRPFSLVPDNTAGIAHYIAYCPKLISVQVTRSVRLICWTEERFVMTLAAVAIRTIFQDAENDNTHMNSAFLKLCCVGLKVLYWWEHSALQTST